MIVGTILGPHIGVAGPLAVKFSRKTVPSAAWGVDLANWTDGDLYFRGGFEGEMLGFVVLGHFLR